MIQLTKKREKSKARAFSRSHINSCVHNFKALCVQMWIARDKLFLNVLEKIENKIAGASIEPTTVGLEPILVEMRHFRWSRPEANIAKRCIKFHRGVKGGILHFDDSLWSKSTIYTLWLPLGPDLDATVNKMIL